MTNIVITALILLATSFSAYATSDAKNLLDSSYKPNNECRELKRQLYKQLRSIKSYNPSVEALLYSVKIEPEFVDDHYCFMPLTIIGFGYLNKLDQKTNKKIDDVALSSYARLLRRIAPELNKYICADKELFKFKPYLLISDEFLNPKKCEKFN